MFVNTKMAEKVEPVGHLVAVEIVEEHGWLGLDNIWRGRSEVQGLPSVRVG